ncbi:MAG: hypothetical protein WD696_07630 [Bryobacteraceae bacterium]
MGTRRRVLAWLSVAVLIGAELPAQRTVPVKQIEEVDIDPVKLALATYKGRPGERILQDAQFRVTRRNRRQPAAAVLVRARTPGSGPSGTIVETGKNEAQFWTNDNGEFTMRGVVANEARGAYELILEVDFVDPSGTRYVGNRSFEIRNAAFPSKTLWILGGAAAAGLGAYFGTRNGDAGNGGGQLPPPVIGFGPGRVGAP